MEESIAKTISDFVAKLNYKNLPEPVVTDAKKRIIDTVGCAISAIGGEDSSILIRTMDDFGKDGYSTVIGSSLKKSSHVASLINSFLSHSLEMDDSLPAVGHIGAIVIPTALALGEELGSSGSEIITAIVAGYEVTSRLGRINLTGHIQNKGFHPTGINGVLGASATAARLMSLSIEQTTNALGIAAGFSSGLLEAVNDGSWTKRLNPGMASYNGIFSAKLAKNGFQAPKKIFEGRLGFFNAYAGKIPTLDDIKVGLGERFLITESKFKPFASCKIIHPAIDATLSIIRENKIDPHNVKEIVVRLQSNGIPLVSDETKKKPDNQVQAQFSTFYMVAYTLTNRGPPMLSAIERTSFTRSEILDLADRVKVISDPDLDAEATTESLNRVSIVDIMLEDGRKFSHRSSDNFDSLSMGGVIEKFNSITSRVIDMDQRRILLENFQNLEKYERLNDIMGLLPH